jgi:hypothetical protein
LKSIINLPNFIYYSLKILKYIQYTLNLSKICFSSLNLTKFLSFSVWQDLTTLRNALGNKGCRGLMVMVSGWHSFDRQFEPYLRAFMAVPLRCGLGCRSRTDGRIHRSWILRTLDLPAKRYNSWLLELKNRFDFFIEWNKVLNHSQQFRGRIQKTRHSLDVFRCF